MKASFFGIFMGISMAFSLKRDGELSKSAANTSIIMEVLTIIILSLPSFSS